MVSADLSGLFQYSGVAESPRTHMMPSSLP
jgi:hypothetical protein